MTICAGMLPGSGGLAGQFGQWQREPDEAAAPEGGSEHSRAIERPGDNKGRSTTGHIAISSLGNLTGFTLDKGKPHADQLDLSNVTLIVPRAAFNRRLGEDASSRRSPRTGPTPAVDASTLA